MGKHWKVVAVACAALIGFACSSTDETSAVSDRGRATSREEAEAGGDSCSPTEGTVELTAAEAESTCAGGPVYRFGVVNHLPSTIRQLVILLSPPPEGTPGDSVYLLCPTAEGACAAKVVQSDATSQIAACSFILSSGDDFACRVPLDQSNVRATLSGAIDSGGSVAAEAEATSSLRCDGELDATFETTCDGDPVWRFAVVNTGDVTIRNIAIIPGFNLPNPQFVPKLCPAGDGTCTIVGVLADAIHQHAECEFQLSPGDDFACRITRPETSMISLMIGQSDDGRRIELNSDTTCETPSVP